MVSFWHEKAMSHQSMRLDQQSMRFVRSSSILISILCLYLNMIKSYWQKKTLDDLTWTLDDLMRRQWQNIEQWSRRTASVIMMLNELDRSDECHGIEKCFDIFSLTYNTEVIKWHELRSRISKVSEIQVVDIGGSITIREFKSLPQLLSFGPDDKLAKMHLMKSLNLTLHELGTNFHTTSVRNGCGNRYAYFDWWQPPPSFVSARVKCSPSSTYQSVIDQPLLVSVFQSWSVTQFSVAR